MTSAPHIRLVLWKAAKAIEKVDRASIVGTGLQLSEFTIMEALLHKGPLPINTIGEKVLLTSGSMTAAINRLEKKLCQEKPGRIGWSLLLRPPDGNWQFGHQRSLSKTRRQSGAGFRGIDREGTP